MATARRCTLWGVLLTALYRLLDLLPPRASRRRPPAAPAPAAAPALASASALAGAPAPAAARSVPAARSALGGRVIRRFPTARPVPATRAIPARIGRAVPFPRQADSGWWPTAPGNGRRGEYALPPTIKQRIGAEAHNASPAVRRLCPATGPALPEADRPVSVADLAAAQPARQPEPVGPVEAERQPERALPAPRRRPLTALPTPAAADQAAAPADQADTPAQPAAAPRFRVVAPVGRTAVPTGRTTAASGDGAVAELPAAA